MESRDHKDEPDHDKHHSGKKEIKKGNKKLPPIVQATDRDVLLGRGKSNLNHPGNKVFGALVDSQVDAYQKAKSRHQKIDVTQRILVRVANEGGWFLEKDEERGGWYRINEQRARKKTAQAIQYRLKRGSSSLSSGTGDPPFTMYLPCDRVTQRESISIDQTRMISAADVSRNVSSSSLSFDQTPLSLAVDVLNNASNSSSEANDDLILTDEEILASLGY